tara:strand:+ start:2316 stop:3251 length:936 start_codon:yes stop_codon:yes gene_type:complete
MELIRGIHNIRSHHHGCVLSIGNFDGVHLGHAEVLRNLVAQAQKYNLPSVVMTFEPQPQEFFAPSQSPTRLSLLRDKLCLMRKLGVDYLLCIYFTEKFSHYTGNDFIEHLLVEQLGVRYLVVGDDFKYGRNRQGDFAQLQQAGQQYDFVVERTSSFIYQGERVSSSLIRQCLAEGNLEQARSYLGRNVVLSGRVQHGKKMGRKLGFPTANIALKRKKSPVQGVFAARLRYPGQDWINGVANVGYRPTIHGKHCLLEVHLFDFEQDIYGYAVEVELVKKLRDEQAFTSVHDLKNQITCDAEQARALFQSDAD